MKVAILYICTGKYAIFWEDFYLSAEKYFISDVGKTYFVFTDADAIIYGDAENVKKIHSEKKGWPYDTLMRYHDFVNISDRLKEFDYLFFFNANAVFVEEVTKEEFLPLAHPSGLMGVLHPGYFATPVKKFPYEYKQKKSTAYIKAGEGKHYFAGGINGGKADSFLALCETLKQNIQQDLDKNIIAVWHDESHINRYFFDHPPLVLSPSYVYPEDWSLPFTPKILIRNKSKLGGHAHLRGMVPEQLSTLDKLKNWIIRKIKK